jgi:hypothetical protein
MRVDGARLRVGGESVLLMLLLILFAEIAAEKEFRCGVLSEDKVLQTGSL